MPRSDRSRSRSREGPIIHVSRCENEALSKIIRGVYSFSKSRHHGKPVYIKEKMASGSVTDVFIYYCDMRSGPDFHGWWFGERIGSRRGIGAYAYNPGCHWDNPELPPTANWSDVSRDSVDKELKITIKGTPCPVYPTICVSGCETNETLSKIIQGVYAPSTINHGKLVYKKKEIIGDTKQMDVYIYYWDMRNGASWNGWWFGERIGVRRGIGAYAYNPGSHCDNPALLPASNWKYPSVCGVQKGFKVTINILEDTPCPTCSADGTADQSLLKDLLTIEQALETERLRREAAENQQKILEQKLGVLFVGPFDESNKPLFSLFTCKT